MFRPKQKAPLSWLRRWRPYLAAFLMVAVVTAIGDRVVVHISPTNLVMLYLLVVVIAGFRWGLGAAVLSSILGSLAFDFFLVSPRLSLTIADAEYAITFIALLSVALVVGTLTGRLRDHAAMLDRRERETAALYTFSQSIATTGSAAEIAASMADQIQRTFGRPVSLDDPDLTEDEQRLLEALTTQAAVATERAELAEKARAAELVLATDKLYDALLHSVSHALRTPLASIIGGLSTVLEPGQERLAEATRHELLQTAREEAERLDVLVGNLLDMTRLESGRLKLNIDWYDPADVIGVALGHVAGRLKERPVYVQMAEELPLIPLDQVLIVHVLENLLDNADKYSPPGKPIEVSVRWAEGSLAITVADRGVGIAPEESARLFEKFYRVERPGSPTGIGLGLAICKGIVEAHGGKIWAAPRYEGGTEVTFTVPLPPSEGKAGEVQ